MKKYKDFHVFLISTQQLSYFRAHAVMGPYQDYANSIREQLEKMSRKLNLENKEHETIVQNSVGKHDASMGNSRLELESLNEKNSQLQVQLEASLNKLSGMREEISRIQRSRPKLERKNEEILERKKKEHDLKVRKDLIQNKNDSRLSI